MATKSSSPRLEYHIPFIYALVIRYIEPASAFLGAIFAYTQPYQFIVALTGISNTIQDDVAQLPIPLSQIQDIAIRGLITNLGSSYLLFSLLGTLVLGIADGPTELGMKVWKAVIFAQLVSDVGHLAAFVPWMALNGGSLAFFLKFWEWNSTAWVNLGVLWTVGAVRVAFLSGIGVKKVRGINKSQ